MSRSHSSKLFRVLPVMAALVIGGCGTAAAGKAPNEKILVVALGGDSTGLDPETVTGNDSGYIMSAIYDTLVAYKIGTTEIAPGLADKWEISKDGKTYTFHLHKGVKFQDG